MPTDWSVFEPVQTEKAVNWSDFEPVTTTTAPPKPAPAAPPIEPPPDNSWMERGGMGPTPVFTTPIGGSRPITPLTPEMVPSGANTDYPAITIPASAAAKTAVGFGAFALSPQGAGEMALAATPAAPVILAKWAYDMAKGGWESSKDAVDTLADMAREAFARGIIKANQLPPAPEGVTVQDQLQRLSEDAINSVAMGAGAAHVAPKVPSATLRAAVKLLPRSAFEVTQTKGESNASSVPKTTEVYGNVRPQSVEGEGQMPVDESRQGVQPSAQGVAQEAQVPLSPEGYRVLGNGSFESESAPPPDAQNVSRFIVNGKVTYRFRLPAKVTLTPEEQSYLDAEREGLETTVELTDKLPDDQPFADGVIGTIDRRAKRILINPAEYRKWLAKVPAERRQAAVKALLSEENIHLKVTDAEASAYSRTMTALEKALARRRYHGEWSGEWDDVMDGHEALRFRLQQLARISPREIAETNWLSREGFTVRSITALESTVRGLREALGTKASKESLAILDRIQGNLDAAKAVLGANPSAIRKSPQNDFEKEVQGETEDQLQIRLKNLDSHLDQLKHGLRATGVTREMETRWQKDWEMQRDYIQSELDQRGEQSMPAAKNKSAREEVEPTTGQPIPTVEGIPSSTVEKAIRIEASDHPEVAKSNPELLPQLVKDELGLDKAAYDGEADPVPAAKRKPQLKDTRQEDLFLPPVADVAGLERSVPEAKPFSGLDIERAGSQYLQEQVASMADLGRREASPEQRARIEQRIAQLQNTTPPDARSAKAIASRIDSLQRRLTRPAEVAIDFEHYMDNLRSKFGDVQRGQAFESYQQALYTMLLNAPGETLRSLGNRLEVFGEMRGKKFEPQSIADPVEKFEAVEKAPPLKLEAQPTGEVVAAEREFKKTEKKQKKIYDRMAGQRQRTRLNVVQKIAEKLLQEPLESFQPQKEAVIPDDIRTKSETSLPSFFDITKRDIADPKALGNALTTDARRRPTDPVSMTKRLTLLVPKGGGPAYLVSTYKTRGGAMLLDPSLSTVRAHRSLQDILTKYRPVASVLLDEPVQSFRQKFESLADFEERFGREARAIAEQQPLEASQATFSRKGRADYATRQEAQRLLAEGAKSGHATAEELAAAATEKQLRRASITQPEAQAILDTIWEEVGEFKERSDMDSLIDGLAARADEGSLTARDWQAISGLAKVYDSLTRKWKELTPDQIKAQTLDELYDLTSSKAGHEEISKAIVAKYTPEVRQAPSFGKAAPAKGRQVEVTTLRTYPPTVVPGKPLPKGAGPVPTLPPPRGPAMLPPSSRPAPIPFENRGTFDAPNIGRPAGPIRTYGKPAPIQPGTFIRASLQPELATRAPAAVRKQVKRFARKGVTAVIAEPLRKYSEWMNERIAREGGKTSKAFADAVNIIVSRQKEIAGQLTPTLDPALKEAGKLFSKATKYANTVKEVTDKAGVANVVQMIEKPAIPLPDPSMDAAVNSWRLANLEIGRLYQAGNPNFRATGKFERNLTALGYDIVRSGATPLRRAFAEGLAKVNYNPHHGPSLSDWVAMSYKFLKEYKKLLDDPAPDGAAIEKVNQDYVRKFPKTITHLKVGGMWQPIIHANIYNYLKAGSQKASHIAAFRESFPLAAKGAFKKLIEKVQTELGAGAQADLDALVRSLQGHPTDTFAASDLLGPGKFYGESFNFLNQTVGNIFAKLVLSGQMFVQPGETISGSTPVFLGGKNYLRAVDLQAREAAEFLKGAAGLPSHPNHLNALLEQQGMINRAMYDMSYDPSAPLRSGTRIAGNTISKAFAEQFLNELQEKLAATTAMVVTERIRAGTLDSWETRMLPQTFRMMGFTKPQVVEMMRGNPELLGQFERKAAAWLTSGNRAIAEGPRMAGSRMFNSLFRFQSYPMMKINQFRKVVGNLAEAFEKGTGPDKWNAANMMGRFLFGNTLQGVLTVALTTWAYQNFTGLAIRAHEAKDDPFEFLMDAFMATTGGPLYLMLRAAKDKGVQGIGDQAVRALFPLTVTKEMMDFAAGTGPYRDRVGMERIARFLEQKLPGAKAFKTGIAIAGLAGDDQKLDTSILAFYRWRRSNLGFTDYEPFFEDDERKQFRIAMRRAISALKAGNFDKYTQYAADAEELQGKKALKSSLQARKVLQSPTGKDLTPEQMDALTKHIGQDAVDRIEDFDALLEHLAQ